MCLKDTLINFIVVTLPIPPFIQANYTVSVMTPIVVLSFPSTVYVILIYHHSIMHFFKLKFYFSSSGYTCAAFLI